LEEPATFKSP